MHRDLAPDDARALPHRTEPRPLHFPWEESVPESVLHLVLRTFVYELLRFVLSGRAFVGSDQFVYFDGSDPKRCVGPDVYVAWGARDGTDIKSWKTWERGTPALCVEIDNSAIDASEWSEKLSDYRAMGAREVVYFAPEAKPGTRLRVWDRIDDDLVERVIENDATPCLALGLYWVVRAIENAPVALRLAEDPEGRRLVLDRTETERAAREVESAARQAEAAARMRAERERNDALARVAELEAELRRRGG